MTIECCICLDQYQPDGDKCPKLLPCSHTLCLQCLRELHGRCPRIQCPECRAPHDVPDGNVVNFPTNRYVLENLEQRQRIVHLEETEEQVANDAAEAEQPMLQATNREHPQVHADVRRNNRDVARNNLQLTNSEQVHADVGRNNRGVAQNNQQPRNHEQVHADVRRNNRGVAQNNQQPRNHEQVHADVRRNNRGVAQNNQQPRNHEQVHADVRRNNRGVAQNNQQPRNHEQVHADVRRNNRGVA